MMMVAVVIYQRWGEITPSLTVSVFLVKSYLTKHSELTCSHEEFGVTA